MQSTRPVSVPMPIHLFPLSIPIPQTPCSFYWCITVTLNAISQSNHCTLLKDWTVHLQNSWVSLTEHTFSRRLPPSCHRLILCVRRPASYFQSALACQSTWRLHKLPIFTWSSTPRFFLINACIHKLCAARPCWVVYRVFERTLRGGEEIWRDGQLVRSPYHGVLI